MIGRSGGARDRILRRVGAATAARERRPHPGALAGDGPDDVVAAFADRFRRSGGEVVAAGMGWRGGELLRWLRDQVPEVTAVATAPDLPGELRPDLPEVAAREAGAGVSVGWGGVAETGSLILPSTGGRAVQLLPPLHIVWISADRIFARLEHALLSLAADLPAAAGLHSGPSKSADIGRTVVTGVHGPGRCVAFVRGALRSPAATE